MKLNTLKKYWKSLLITAIVLVLSFVRFGPIEGLPEFRFTDKLIHVLMYFTYAIVLMYDYNSDTQLHHSKSSFVAICIGIPLLVGGITETLQPLLFAPRQGDIFDFVSNSAGVLVAWGMRSLFRKKHK